MERHCEGFQSEGGLSQAINSIDVKGLQLKRLYLKHTYNVAISIVFLSFKFSRVNNQKAILISD